MITVKRKTALPTESVGRAVYKVYFLAREIVSILFTKIYEKQIRG